MDSRLAEMTVHFDIAERQRAAERVHVQIDLSLADRIAFAVGHMLVRTGTRLERVADRRETTSWLELTNPDPCGGCAN